MNYYYNIYNNRSRNRKRTIFTYLFNMSGFLQIILFTSIISILGFILFAFNPGIIDNLALLPKNILKGKTLWALFTHLLFHANFFHLFVNMFSLFFIGNITETIIGKKRFLGFYFIAGIIAGIFYISLALLGDILGYTQVLGSLNIAGVGASGALFGLIGILTVIIPRKKVILLAGPIVLIIISFILQDIFSGPLLNFLEITITLLIFLSILSIFIPSRTLRFLALNIEMPLWIAPIIAIVPLVLISYFISLPIGNSAHLGGLIAGLIYGYFLKSKYPKKVNLVRRIIR